MDRKIILLFIVAGHWLAWLLMAIMADAVTGALVVLAIVLIEVAVWQREKVIRTVAAATVRVREQLALWHAQQQSRRDTQRSRVPLKPSLASPKKPGEPANGGRNVHVSIEGSWGRFASADERRDYLNKVRRDSAAKAWRSAPQAYNPIPELSFTATCPYCDGSFAKGKRPSRRSRFTCKLCKNTVCVDAWHRIFPTCYLNAKQGLLARYLGELNNMAGAAGTSEDFWWFAQQKDWTRGKCPLSDQEAGDVLWGLMNYSVLEMQNILPREEVSAFAVHAQMLQELMKRYRQDPYPIDGDYYSTEVGEFEESDSPYGTFDQSGNFSEWNEALSGSERGLRGGALYSGTDQLVASWRHFTNPAATGANVIGFRVASVPEPSTFALLTTATLTLLVYAWRRRRC